MSFPFNKFDCFTLDLSNGKHRLTGTTDILKLYLANTAPDRTNEVYGDVPDLPSNNGNAVGGVWIGRTTGTESGGVFTFGHTGQRVVFPADGGAVGPFRHVVMYNSSYPSLPLIGWYTLDRELSIPGGGAFSFFFDANDPTIFTIR